MPAFLLVPARGELRRPAARTVAALGAAIALVLTPLTPAGLAIAAAAFAAILGLRR